MEEIILNVCDCTKVEEVIIKFNQIDNYSIKYKFTIVLGNYVSSEILALIVAMHSYKTYKKYDIIINIKGENTYASRVDFYKLLGVEQEENFSRHSSVGKFVEITNFNSQNNVNLVNSIMKIFKENTNLSSVILGCINYCFFEVVDNVENHAKSPIGGYLLAQSYPQKKEIRIIIIDCGRGIHKSLTEGKKYCNLTDEESIRLCIGENVTNGNGMGNGLYHTSKFIKSVDGELAIYSGNKKIVIHKKKQSVIGIPYYNGTIVSMLIKNCDSVNLKDIFRDNIPITVSEFEECVNDLW